MNVNTKNHEKFESGTNYLTKADQRVSGIRIHQCEQKTIPQDCVWDILEFSDDERNLDLMNCGVFLKTVRCMFSWIQRLAL